MPEHNPDTLHGARERVRQALAAGDVLMAYDAASSLAAREPSSLEARYLLALSLARSGSIMRAAIDAEHVLVEMRARNVKDLRLLEDVQALSARLTKERALAASGDARARLAEQAAERYERSALELGGHYSYVNAATLWLLAGRHQRSTRMAKKAMRAVEETADLGPEAAYWRWASAAEASLLLGDVVSTRDSLTNATNVPGVGAALYAVTRRQLALVCSLTGAEEEVLDQLKVPSVAHYCGHRVTAQSGPDEVGEVESALVGSVAEALKRHNIGIAYGSLAAGADIVMAEQLVALGGELNVVLPFDVDEFEECSVRPSGDSWVPRFRSLLQRAASVPLTCDSSYLGDDNLFAYASLVAMGRSRNRARMLTTTACQIAVWDHQPGPASAGTSHDIRVWRRTGGLTHIISLSTDATIKADSADERIGLPGVGPTRVVRAVLFADFRGFSLLRDEHYSTVVEQLFAPLANSIEPYRPQLLFHKTWGDGIQLVFKTVAAAGRAALAMQESVNRLDVPSLGLPADMRLRIGAHVGPLFRLRDPFSRRLEWWGREMTRAARIEPRTPEGEVYVTDAFAALLALEPECDCTTEYVGRVTTAKDFETIPMYRLCRRDELV